MAAGVGPNAASNGAGPTSAVEQSLYSHLYGKEMGLMRKLSNIDDYSNHAAVARNYQQLLQHPDSVIPPGAGHPQMQQNFAAHSHAAAAAAKFNQFNYPNPGGLLKPCYDYASQQQQHPLQSHQTGTAGTATPAPNQQMKKEIFNLSGSNGVDLYTPSPAPAATTSSSGAMPSPASTANGQTSANGGNASVATTASSMANGGGGGSLSFMNLHQPSAAAAAAAAMYANHFNGSKLDNGGEGLVDFNPMRNNSGPQKGGGGVGGNNLIKSAESVLMARSSIMNNLNNNLNKIEPNTDTTLNDNNNNTHNHHHQQQQSHNHLASHQHQHQHGGGGFHHQMGGGSGPGNNDDDNDKLSSPLTGASTLTNTDLNDPENDSNDDGYTIL